MAKSAIKARPQDKGKTHADTAKSLKDWKNSRADNKAAAVSAAAKKSAPAGKPEAAADKAGASGFLVLRKSALSTDVGPRVIKTLYGFDARVREITDEMHELKGTKRYEQLSELTLAVVKAAKAESKIDLSTAFSGDPKAWGGTLNQLGIALGFREVKKTEPDKNGVQFDAVVTAQAVKDSFPMPGETEKNCADYKRKDTFRANFLTQFKKCAQAAYAIIEEKIDAKYDHKAGTMLISGPAVKRAFGQERVALDERKVIGTGDAKVELTEKPSFTSLGNIGAVKAGAGTVNTTGQGAGQHRGTSAGTVAGAAATSAQQSAQQATGKLGLDKAIVSICNSLKATLEKATKIGKEATDALEELQNAIEVKLGNA